MCEVDYFKIKCVTAPYLLDIFLKLPAYLIKNTQNSSSITFQVASCY